MPLGKLEPAGKIKRVSEPHQPGRFLTGQSVPGILPGTCPSLSALFVIFYKISICKVVFCMIYYSVIVWDDCIPKK